MTIPPTKLNLIGGVDISLPNVSYCEDVKDVHYLPYNLVRFYVGEITRATPQTVNIYTDSSTSVDITVSEGNKWYTYVLPKDKGLCKIEGDSVKKVVAKADISFEGKSSYPYVIIIPNSVVEASFKGSDTSNVTNMRYMFHGCDGLTSLNLSKWDTSKVTNMSEMFFNCSKLTSLDVSSFNTSNVTDMSSMFSGCTSLASLDVSSFNTSNVTNMEFMFAGCSGLTSLDLSGWDMSNVTDTSWMFNGCTALKIIRMKGCSEATVNKIKAQLTTDGISLDKVNIITE